MEVLLPRVSQLRVATAASSCRFTWHVVIHSNEVLTSAFHDGLSALRGRDLLSAVAPALPCLRCCCMIVMHVQGSREFDTLGREYRALESEREGEKEASRKSTLGGRLVVEEPL